MADNAQYLSHTPSKTTAWHRPQVDVAGWCLGRLFVQLRPLVSNNHLITHTPSLSLVMGATPVTAPVKELLTPSVCRALCLPVCIAECTTYIQTRVTTLSPASHSDTHSVHELRMTHARARICWHAHAPARPYVACALFNESKTV